MTDRKVIVKIDYDKMVGYVTRNCVEKYARKLLQDKLKAETPFKGGWYCFLTNSDWDYLPREKWTAWVPHERYDSGHATRPWNEDDDNFYIFELNNGLAQLSMGVHRGL